MSSRNLAQLMTLAGAASILGSIAIWATRGGAGTTPEERAHGERFGIVVGLWAPTFFILANRYNAHALREE